MNNAQLLLRLVIIMKRKSIKFWIGAVFALMCSIPAASFAQVIFSDNYDSSGDAGWNCSKGTLAGYSGQSSCPAPTSIGGTTHYAGEISTGGRTGNSLKLWRTNGGFKDYGGYLDKFLTSSEFNNHYKELYIRWYMKISPDWDANLGTAYSHKLNRTYIGSSPGATNAEWYFNINGGTFKSGKFMMYKGAIGNWYSSNSVSQLGINDGKWHAVEWRVKLNTTTGSTDGGFQLFVDGNVQTLCDGSGNNCSTNHTMNTGESTTQYFTSLAPPAIGNLTDGTWNFPTNGWYDFEFDDYVVSTSYIGPDNSGTTPPPVTVVNGTCGSASGKSYTSLTSSSSNLCATGTVASFTGTGPWTWGCNGSGGGVSTSSKACSASLTPPPVTTPPADTTAPTISITSPTTRTTYSTASSTITLSGTASDNVACSSVKWTCPTCKPSSGTATGTTSWSLSSIGLASGSNAITVTAKDSSNNTSSDSITVTSTAVVSNPINGTCGSASGQSYATLTSGSANLCATGTVASFAGAGPWKWGCNGSGGGTNTAATACSAALSSQTVLFSENFEDNNYLNRGWYDGTHFDIINSQHAGGSQAAQFSFAQGATTWTGSTGAMRHLFTPTDSLYISYYIKFSSGWRGSQKTYHPHFIHIASDLDDQWCPLANNYLEAYSEFIADVGSPYTIRPQLALQDEKRVNMSNGTPPNNLSSITENRSVNYCNTPLSSGATGTCYADSTYYSANTWKASAAAVSTNTWHHVEVYMKMNTISGGKGQSNGVMQEWLDGSLVINHSDILYRTNQDATKKWAQFVMAPYIGDGSPIAQTIWFDDLTVATAPPSNATSLSAPTGFIVVPK